VDHHRTFTPKLVPSSHANQLALPAELAKNPESAQLLGIWTLDDNQYYLIDIAKYPTPEAWGIFAMDMIRHSARAFEHAGHGAKTEMYKRILAGFAAEMQDPTEPL
jgi:hypothetical protein